MIVYTLALVGAWAYSEASYHHNHTCSAMDGGMKGGCVNRKCVSQPDNAGCEYGYYLISHETDHIEEYADGSRINRNRNGCVVTRY